MVQMSNSALACWVAWERSFNFWEFTFPHYSGSSFLPGPLQTFYSQQQMLGSGHSERWLLFSTVWMAMAPMGGWLGLRLSSSFKFPWGQCDCVLWEGLRQKNGFNHHLTLTIQWANRGAEGCFQTLISTGKDLMCAKRALQVRANTKECFLIALLTFPLHWAPANRHQLWLVEEAGRRSIRFFISPGSEGWKVVVERTYWWIISESVNQQPDSRVWVWVLGDPRYKGNY